MVASLKLSPFIVQSLYKVGQQTGMDSLNDFRSKRNLCIEGKPSEAVDEQDYVGTVWNPQAASITIADRGR